MKLLYKAVSADGKQVKGTIEAKSIPDAASFLRSRFLYPVSIQEEKKSELLKYIPLIGKSSSSDIVFLTRQLSSMLVSGLTLLQALAILKDQVQNPATRDIMKSVVADVEDGKPFSTAISKYPDTFSKVYVASVKSGEASGQLDKVFLRLSDNLEKSQKLKGTIKSALMYPAIVITGMVIVMGIMMTFVIPQLSTLYESLEIELPLPTKIMVFISEFTINFWFIEIAFFLMIFYAFRRWHKTDSGRLLIDQFSLKVPIFGKLFKQAILTEFTRTMGLMIGSGTLVVEALEQSAEVAGNELYKNAIYGVAKRVEKGVTVGDALAAYPLFPSLLVELIKIGEKTGKIDESFLRISEYYERELDLTVKNLTTALEPIIMVVLGAGVAFLIISIITPIYSLISEF